MRVLLLPCLVLAVVAAVFAAVPRGGPVFDDFSLIVGNPRVTGPFDFGACIREPLWGASRPYWRPLTLTALAAGWHAGGMAGLHVLSLAVHLAAVAAAWRIARLLGAGQPQGQAAIAALLFGVHPVQVESVAWAAALSDPLWGLCALNSLGAFLRHRLGGRAGLPAAAIVWLGVGLACKETAVVIVLLLVAADCMWPHADGTWRRRRRDVLLLLGVLAGWWLARALVYGSLLAGFDRGASEFVLSPGRIHTARVEILGRQFLGLVWPWQPDALRPMQPQLGVLEAGFVIPAAATLALVVAAVLAWRRRSPLAGLALLLFVFPLLPGLALPRGLNTFPVADRYLYVAPLGLGLLLVRGLAGSRAGRVLLCALATAFAVRSWTAVPQWASQEQFAVTHAARHPENPRLRYNLAATCLERYQSTGAREHLAHAEAGFLHALELAQRPAYGGDTIRGRLIADIRLGLAWCAFARQAEASTPDWGPVAALFEGILATHNDVAEAHIGLAMCLIHLGRADAAERHLLVAARLDPHRPDARELLATLRRQRR